MRKAAVFFPGIGYTVDKPLMHYSRRLAAERGYEIKLIPYTGFPSMVRGDREKMAECFRIAKEQTEQLLADFDPASCDDLLLVGKSIGTILAAQLAAAMPAEQRLRMVLYTPLEDTFSFPARESIAFTGTADPWVGKEKSRIPELCESRKVPCIRIPGGNHSLETGDVQKDLKNMRMIMNRTQEFLDA